MTNQIADSYLSAYRLTILGLVNDEITKSASEPISEGDKESATDRDWTISTSFFYISIFLLLRTIEYTAYSC